MAVTLDNKIDRAGNQQPTKILSYTCAEHGKYYKIQYLTENNWWNQLFKA